MGTTTKSARRAPRRNRAPGLLCMTCTVELIDRTILALEGSVLSDEGGERLSNSDDPAPVEFAIMAEAVIQPVRAALLDFEGDGRGSDPVLSGIFWMLYGLGDYVQGLRSCVGQKEAPGVAHFIIGLPSLLKAAGDRLRNMILEHGEHGEPQLAAPCEGHTAEDQPATKEGASGRG